MLVIRGVNVFPSEIEAVLLDDEAVGAQYAIVVDSRGTMKELEVRPELAEPGLRPRADEVAARLRERLAERLRIRVAVVLGPPGSIPRQELGKARRVFERTAEHDPFPD
jgi:phenylacetate-CoA ligase